MSRSAVENFYSGKVKVRSGRLNKASLDNLIVGKERKFAFIYFLIKCSFLLYSCAFVKLSSLKDSKRLITEFKYARFKDQRLDVRLTAARDFSDYRIRHPPKGKVFLQCVH